MDIGQYSSTNELYSVGRDYKEDNDCGKKLNKDRMSISYQNQIYATIRADRGGVGEGKSSKVGKIQSHLWQKKEKKK